MSFDWPTYIEDNLDSVKKSTGPELNASCPFCSKPDHFYINTDSGNYCCFKCDSVGRRGVGLVMQVEGISRAEAWKFILKQGVKSRRKETAGELASRIRALRGNELEDDIVDIPLPKEFIPVFKAGKWRVPIYLKERGVKRSTAQEWNIGWARRGRYSGRVIIPVVCPNGRSLTARAVDSDQQPKYLNPPNADHGKLLLGWEHADRRRDIVLVEGPLDIVKAWQHGLRGYALMGKVLHMEQLRLLMKHSEDSSITVMLDPEEKIAPYKIAQQLLCRFSNVHIASLPAGVDPGSASKKQIKLAYDNAAKYNGERHGVLAGIVGFSRDRLSKRYS